MAHIRAAVDITMAAIKILITRIQGITLIPATILNTITTIITTIGITITPATITARGMGATPAAGPATTATSVPIIGIEML